MQQKISFNRQLSHIGDADDRIVISPFEARGNYREIAERAAQKRRLNYGSRSGIAASSAHLPFEKFLPRVILFQRPITAW